MNYNTASVGKGHSRLGTPLYILMQAMRGGRDSADPDLSCVQHVLRVAHAIPVNFTFHEREEGYNFDKLMISHRSASCRQKPNPLKSARMFQRLATSRRDKNPELVATQSFADTLDDIILDYHAHKGVLGNSSYQVKDAELEATKNVALFVSADAMEVAFLHLDKFKWVDSGGAYVVTMFI